MLGRASKPLILLLACRMATAMAAYVIIPFLMLYLTKELGFSIPLATAAMLLLVLVPGILGPLVGAWQDRVSSKFLLNCGCVLSIIGLALLMGRPARPLLAFVAVGLLAAGGSVFSISFNTAVPRMLPAGQMTLAFSLMHSTANVGSFLGPALAGFILLAGKGPREVMAVSIACYALSMLLFLTLLPAEAPPEAPQAPAAEMGKPAISALALLNVAYLLLFFIDWANIAQTSSFLTQFVSDSLGEPAVAGFFFSAQAIPVIIFVPLAGRCMQGWSVEKLFKVYTVGVAAFPLGFLACHLVGRFNPHSGLVVLGLFMVFQEMLTIPSGGALAAELVPNKKYGMIFGWRSSAVALGRAFGTSTGGYFYQQAASTGSVADFWGHIALFSLALWAGVAAFAFYSLVVRERSAAGSASLAQPL